MGIKTKINRLFCIPCKMMRWIYNKMRKKSSDTYCSFHLNTFTLVPIVVFLALIGIWLLTQLLAMWIFSSVTWNSERSVQGDFMDESYFILYRKGSTKTSTKNNPLLNGKFGDRFSQANFIHLKLQHLIALSYLTTPYHGKSSKNLKLSSSKNEQELFPNMNFTFLLNELNVVLKVQNFYVRQWGCPEITGLKFPGHVVTTQHTKTGNAVYNGKSCAIQSSVADVDELIAAKCGSADSDKSLDNINRCFLLKNRRMLQQYLFLQELSHPNIAKLYGVCINPGTARVPSVFTLAKEAGMVVDMNKLVSQPWNQRLKMALDLVSLASYFARSPMGSIMLENWNPENFIITQDGSTSFTIKLSNFDQNIILTEKSCKRDRDCPIGKISSATKCSHGLCKGYNEKQNLYNIYYSFIKPILDNQVPHRISDDANKVFSTMRNLQCNSTVLLQLLRFLQPSQEDVDADGRESQKGNLLLPGVLNRQPDGIQVDSWEQHENHIAINEVDFNQLPADPNNVQQDVNNIMQDGENIYKDTYGYKKIENADYPGRYDYYCPHSKAEWGCVVSLRKLEDAAKKCDDDAKCKAFVTMPHLRKEGWIIVILKSDNTRAVDHAGTTVYIKSPKDENTDTNKEIGEGALSKDSNVVKLCLQDLVQAQESAREKREENLMIPCGWEGLSDAKWQSLVLEATVGDATKFKPSRGKMAIGGQMNIMLESASKPSPSLFLAKRGPEEYHLAQLTTYHLDRMLGLYKVVPAFLRTLTEQEMTDAGFPVDIGGNQFDVFRQLKNADRSLSGTIVPIVSGRLGVEHYISVPKLSQITNAVTPFSKRQWNDLEYLLLMWLASLPMPTKGHPSLQGHLIHIKADEAFKSEPSPVVLSYFYNCHFPRIAIDVLRNLRSAHCNFGDQLVARVRTAYPDLQVNAFSFKVPVADIATRNANRLLEVVDLCVRKFGDKVVLYDS